MPLTLSPSHPSKRLKLERLRILDKSSWIIHTKRWCAHISLSISLFVFSKGFFFPVRFFIFFFRALPPKLPHANPPGLAIKLATGNSVFKSSFPPLFLSWVPSSSPIYRTDPVSFSEPAARSAAGSPQVVCSGVIDVPLPFSAARVGVFILIVRWRVSHTRWYTHMFLLVQQFLRHNENFFFFARSIVSLKKRTTTESPVREREKKL